MLLKLQQHKDTAHDNTQYSKGLTSSRLARQTEATCINGISPMRPAQRYGKASIGSMWNCVPPHPLRRFPLKVLALKRRSLVTIKLLKSPNTPNKQRWSMLVLPLFEEKLRVLPVCLPMPALVPDLAFGAAPLQPSLGAL